MPARPRACSSPGAVVDLPSPPIAEPMPAVSGRLADAMPQLVWIARPDGVIEYYNERVRDYAGARLEEGTWRWEPLIHPDDLEGTGRAWMEASAGEGPYEYEHRIRMADGAYRWHLSRARRVVEPDGVTVRWYGTATDIHELREAQEAVARIQASLGLAMRGGRMGWWSRDIRTNEVTWSAELEEIVGLGPGSFGGSESAFYDLVHPDDRAFVGEAVEHAVASRGDYVVEFRYRHADGTWRWMEGRGRAVYEGEAATWLFGLGIDVTERRRADEVREAFLGMLSHELRTPVTSIYGMTELLRRDRLDEATRRGLIEDVGAESQRLEQLVENLLVLARVERNAELGGHDPILVRQLVNRVVEAELRAHRVNGRQAQVGIDVEPGVMPAMGDEPSVELCLRNLVSNALKYGAVGGRIDVRVRQVGHHVELCVLDRGPGLDDEDPGRVFELFYRARSAKLVAPGAGVGLYVVKALVEGMGGRVWASNRDGGGAELGLSLPVFEDSGSARGT